MNKNMNKVKCWNYKRCNNSFVESKNSITKIIGECQECSDKTIRSYIKDTESILYRFCYEIVSPFKRFSKLYNY